MKINKKNKRVAIVMPNFSVIGAQRIAIDYGNELLRRGYQVTWVSGDGGEFFNEAKGNTFLYSPVYLRKIRVLRYIESLLALANHLKKNDYDVIISIAPFLNRVLCLFRALSVFSSRLVIEDHACPPYSYYDEFKNFITLNFYRRTEFLYKQADAFRVLSPESRDYYHRRLGNDLAFFMPNFLSLDRVRKLANTFVPDEAITTFPMIVYVGRLTSQKNVSFLLDSFFKLHSTMPCKLIIIGDGPEKNKLIDTVIKNKCTKDVIFLASSGMNFGILARADVFPMTSLWEGMPLVMIEAMSLGIPVVTTNFPAGPSFLLGENERGIVIDTTNTFDFSQALKMALLDRQAAKSRSKLASEFVKDNIDISINFHKYIEKFIENA
jgi:glycosyltransferase involved in cell wall biosynthesis